MPKRTNEFQRLVLIVKNHAAAGAKVVESKLLKDRITGTRREVDICIRTKVAGHSVVVSIECRAHSRKADVTWVEAMRSKHDRLATNALVLVSSTGFTQEAIDVAKVYGIETVELESLDSQAAQQLFGGTGILWTKALSVTPTKVVFGLMAAGDLPEERVDVLSHTGIYLADGTLYRVAIAVVNAMTEAKHITEALCRNVTEAHHGFEMTLEPVGTDTGEPLFVKSVEPAVLRAIKRVEITGKVAAKVSQIALKRGRLGESNVAWGAVAVQGKHALFVATHDVSGAEKASLHLNGDQIIRLNKPGSGTRYVRKEPP